MTEPQRFTDPNGRQYEIGPDGQTRWVDEQTPAFAQVVNGPASTGKAKTKRRWVLPTSTGVLGFILGAAIAGAGGAASTDDTTAAAAAPAVTKTVSGPIVTQTVAPIATVTVKAEPPKPRTDIEEGVWLVGTDVAPGRYRMVDAFTDTDGFGCYWEVATGGNFDDIVANDNVTGGKATVTLKKDQQFTNNGCGGWTKVG